MPYNEKLAGRIREALAHLPDVEEKKMFGSIAFMVNGKLTIAAGKDRIMCRIDPLLHDELTSTAGVETVKMRGHDYKGYVHVNEELIKTKKGLDKWVTLVLGFRFPAG